MAENIQEGVVLTPDGKRKLEEELNDLKVVKRAQVVKDIAEARAHGDLSENAEYDEAKNEEARVNSRIMQLEELLANAIVVDEKQINTDTVSVGTIVTVFDEEYQEEDEYVIVGFTEADPSKLHISAESPIGAALMGKSVGDVCEAQTPGGTIKLTIREIKRR
ncbi:MAG: transcription elongation factor GreA [Clostridia bacterium]|nr:transcription elongation factor GreA [Clostridia bacterium]MBQ4156608.1 transcription elongation factor GreA [Clostridia bacterium]